MEKLQYNNNLYLQWEVIESNNPQLNKYLLDLSEKTILNKEEIVYRNNILGLKELEKAIELKILIVENNVIKFVNTDVLLYYFVKTILNDTLIKSIDDLSKKLDFIDKVFYSKRKDDEHAKAIMIIILNNEYSFNISKKISDCRNDKEKNVFWKIIYPYSKALPFLSVEPEDLISVLNMYIENSQNSMNFTEIEESLSEYVFNQFENGLKLYEYLLGSPEEKAVSFIPFITLGFSKRIGLESSLHYAFDLIKNENIVIAKQGIYACSLFNYDLEENKEHLQITLNKFCTIIDEGKINLIPSVINGIRILIKYKDELKKQIVKLSKSKDPEIQFEISRLLRTHKDKCNEEEWYLESLNNLIDINILYKGTIDNIKSVLHPLVKKNPIYVFEFFEKWINNHDFETSDRNKDTLSKLFNYVIIDLLKNNIDLFNEYITKLYNNENSKYHTVITNIILDLSLHRHIGFKLSKKILNTLKIEDINFIVLKILGYVYDYKLLCPLVFSVLEKDDIDSDVCDIVQSSFDNYIAYNYPGYSGDFLNKKINEGNEIEIKVAKQILKNLSKYQDALRSLPHLKEFETSNFRKEKFYRLRAKLQSEQMEKVQKEGTSLFSLIRHTIMKGGKSSFTKFEGKFTKKSYLSQIKTSYEVPMAELLDPIYQSFFRYQCRTLKKRQ
ncbi:MAG: hypothetical protein WC358_00260 [Ignavibacteria bacterium]|jgi:hypothetical protein